MRFLSVLLSLAALAMPVLAVPPPPAGSQYYIYTWTSELYLQPPTVGGCPVPNTVYYFATGSCVNQLSFSDTSCLTSANNPGCPIASATIKINTLADTLNYDVQFASSQTATLPITLSLLDEFGLQAWQSSPEAAPEGSSPGGNTNPNQNFVVDYTAGFSSGLVGAFSGQGGAVINSMGTTVGVPGSATWLEQSAPSTPGAPQSTISGQIIFHDLLALPSVVGDPQFVGLQGQSFQVHGMADEYFNLVSSPNLQVNAKFAFISMGSCTYNDTACFTHPGTYVSELGFMTSGVRVRMAAGSHDTGMTVYVNDKQTRKHSSITVGNVTISHPSDGLATFASDLFTFDIHNSDMFFNFGVELHSAELLRAGAALQHLRAGSTSYPVFPLHGLIGQTWMNARYDHGQMFQGTVDDYMLSDSHLFSTAFVHNQFQQ